MLPRRDVLKGMGGATLAAAFALKPHLARAGLPAGAEESAVLEALAGKKPLVKRSFRPPNYETPVSFFNELYTPNDAFFVRYHLGAIPQVAARDWRLRRPTGERRLRRRDGRLGVGLGAERVLRDLVAGVGRVGSGEGLA